MQRTSPSSVILVDSRQQAGKHDLKHSMLEEAGYTLIRATLRWGDYCVIPSRSWFREGIQSVVPEGVSIDTKKDLYELAANLGAQHDRFHREYEGASEHGVRLIVAVCNEDGIDSLGALEEWEEPTDHLRMRRAKAKKRGGDPSGVRPFKGAPMAKACRTISQRYGTVFAFGTEEQVADLINRMAGGEPWNLKREPQQ